MLLQRVAYLSPFFTSCYQHYYNSVENQKGITTRVMVTGLQQTQFTSARFQQSLLAF